MKAVALRELIGFAQSFMPPDEAMLQFRTAYTDAALAFDEGSAPTEFDMSIAEDVISRSVGNMESLSVGNMVRAFVERGAFYITDLLAIIQGVWFYFEFLQDLVLSSIVHSTQG